MRKMTVIYYNRQRHSVRLIHVTGRTMREGKDAALADYPLNTQEGEHAACVLWGHHEMWQDGDKNY